MLVTSAAAASAAGSLAQWKPNGQKDFVWGQYVAAAGGSGTAYKPENKLFYTPQDKKWWGVFGAASAANAPDGPGVYIYQLTEQGWTTNTGWRLTGAAGDQTADQWEKADTLFDTATNTLYVSTRDNRNLTNNPPASHIYRRVYTGSGWSKPSTGPASGIVVTKAVETLSITVDSRTRVWAAYRYGTSIRVAHTGEGDLTFAPALTLSKTAVTTDDISAVTAFGTDEGKIGVMWSDQNTSSANGRRFWFAWRADADGADDKSSWRYETAYGGKVGGCPTNTSARCADDHINLKVEGDTVYAVVKTSLNDETKPNAQDPLVVILRRDGSAAESSRWSSFEVSPVQDDASRPILVISPSLDLVEVIAEKHFQGLYRWETSLSSLDFSNVTPVPWILAGSGNTANVVDPTSTRQVFDATTGVVVEASYAGAYYHNELCPSAC